MFILNLVWGNEHQEHEDVHPKHQMHQVQPLRLPHVHWVQPQYGRIGTEVKSNHGKTCKDFRIKKIQRGQVHLRHRQDQIREKQIHRAHRGRVVQVCQGPSLGFIGMVGLVDISPVHRESQQQEVQQEIIVSRISRSSGHRPVWEGVSFFSGWRSLTSFNVNKKKLDIKIWIKHLQRGYGFQSLS